MANKSLLATCISALLRLKGPERPLKETVLGMGPVRRIKEWGTLSPDELLTRSDTSERRATLWWVSLLTGTWNTNPFNMRVKYSDASLPGA
jgi:hypothetical protein